MVVSELDLDKEQFQQIIVGFVFLCAIGGRYS
jgi:hypothetical protein